MKVLRLRAQDLESSSLGLPRLWRRVRASRATPPHALTVHAAAAGELLELLVRLLDVVAAHHRLDGLGQHLPVTVQVSGHGARVGLKLAQTLPAG